MKRVFPVVGLVVLLLFLLTLLIWQPKQDVERVQPQDKQTVYELRFGHNIPVDSAMHQAALRYAKEVAEKTQGKVRITVYPEQQLGDDHQMVEMARAGELDIILTPTAKMSVPVPAMQYADLPFLFPSRQDAYELLDGEPGLILLNKLLDIDLVGVTFWENGFKHFTGNKPLVKPEDFNGLKIRTMKSRIIMDQFKAMGAYPVPIDFHATRQALADKVVDGQENPLIAIVSMGFHKEQSDLTLSEHAYLAYIFSISNKVFAKLPQSIQEVLISTAKEITPWERAETQRREKALIEEIRQTGIRIHQLDSDARRQFVEKTKHIIDKFEPVIGADVISKTKELLIEKYGYPTDQSSPILIGVDTDLAMEAKVSGLSIKRGAMMAVEEINAKGGVLGRELSLWVKNHNGIPSKGVSNIQKFISEPNLVAVIGGQHGSVVMAEVEVMQDAQTPFLLPRAAVTQAVENDFYPNYVFRVSANDRFAAPYIMDYLARSYQRPAIFYENSVWGRGNQKLMALRLKEHGLKFVYQEEVNKGRQAFSQSVEKALMAGADVIVMVNKSLEGHSLVNAISQQAKPLPIISHWGIIGGEFWKRSRDDLAKVDLSVFQTFGFFDDKRADVKAFAERYIERFGLSSIRNISEPSTVAHAYDLVHLLALAIEQAGTSDRKMVRQALENLPEYQGLVKRYGPAFTRGRHDALGAEDYHMMRFTKDGVLLPVEQ